MSNVKPLTYSDSYKTPAKQTTQISSGFLKFFTLISNSAGF